jgi:hypothetical protein
MILFNIVGAPFGTLADLDNALLAVLSAILAAMLYSRYRAPQGGLGLAALILALAGAVIAPVGSAMVIARRMGWFEGGLYTVAGFGMIGLWLVGLNLSARQGSIWPRSLSISGIVIGAITALGLLAIVGILRGTVAGQFAPWYVSYVAVAGSSLGWFVLYPIWCIWLGRSFLRK